MLRLTKPGRRGQPSCSTDGVSQFREEIRERNAVQEKKSAVAWLASFFNLAGCDGNSSNELAFPFSVQRDRDTRRRSNNFGIVPLESRPGGNRVREI